MSFREFKLRVDPNNEVTWERTAIASRVTELDGLCMPSFTPRLIRSHR